MEEKKLKIDFNIKVDGFDILKEKVQYLSFLVEETEKTLNFLKDYKFSLSCEYSTSVTERKGIKLDANYLAKAISGILQEEQEKYQEK